MIELIVSTIVLFGPMGLANVFAEQSRHFPGTDFLAKPIDMGKTLRGKPLLGKNKTIRGLVFGTLAGGLAAIIIKYLYLNVGFLNESFDLDKIVPGTFENFNYLLFGLLAGFGAIVGDAVESFFKRQIGIQSGKPWFPFDQTDYILGAIVLTLLYVRLELEVYITLLLVFFVLHLGGKYLGYKIGIGKEPF